MEDKSEVENEIEALQSIFWEDVSIVKEDPKTIQLKIKPSDHVELLMPEKYAQLLLNVEYPEKGYPDELPKIFIEKVAPSSFLNIEKLIETIERVAEESRGMAMVFNLVQSSKDWLDEETVKYDSEGLIPEEEKKQKEQEKEEIKRKEEMIEIKKRTVGTTVTVDSFKKWWNIYHQNLIVKQQQEKPNERPTGKQLFEEGKAVIVDDEQE